jgi:TPR repeat protein
MEPLLPSLHNLPVFYTVVISLLVMAGLSGFALYRQLCRRPPGSRFTRLKGFVLLPLWVLCLIWTGLAVAMGVFVGGMTGSGYYLLLGLGVVPVFVLLTWGLYFWVRGRPLADAGVLLLVPAFFLTVYTVQKQWLCEPLAFSGLGQAQLCTARLYERGEGGALRSRGAAREWYRAAAEQGVAEAEYEVAGFTRGREQKIVWYTVYAQQTGNGRGWKYTVESVNRWLSRIPEPVMRLDLEGLQGTQRQQAIEQWYAQEQLALKAQIPAPEGKALDDLEQQRAVLQKDL